MRQREHQSQCYASCACDRSCWNVVFDRCILKGCLIESFHLIWNTTNWRNGEDFAGCTASSSLLPLCIEDVYHYGCYLWTQNLDIYLLQLLSTALFSSPPHFSSPLSAATLYWHVFVLSFHPFPWHLRSGSGGCLWFSAFFFLLFCLCSSSPWKHKGEVSSSFCLQHMLSSICQAQNVDLSLRLYWSAGKLRHDWIQLSIWYMLLCEKPL